MCEDIKKDSHRKVGFGTFQRKRLPANCHVVGATAEKSVGRKSTRFFPFPATAQGPSDPAHRTDSGGTRLKGLDTMITCGGSGLF